MNHPQTGKALLGRPHGFSDQVPTSCGVPSSKRTRDQTSSVYIHGSIFVVIVAVSYASVAKINLNLLKKKEKAQSSRQLRSNSAARPLAEVTKKHHQQKGKHTFGQGSPHLAQCCICGSVTTAEAESSVGKARTTVFSSHWPHKSTTHLLTEGLGFQMGHSCVNLKRRSPHTHFRSLWGGIRKELVERLPPNTWF